MGDAVDRYPLDPLDGPAAMKDYLNGLERRISELEGQRFVAANLVMVDENGDVRARIGKLVGRTGGDVWGIEVVSQPGTVDWPGGLPFFRTTDDGAEFPYINVPWVVETATAVTSATFVDVFTAGIGIVEHLRVAAFVRVQTPAGTTGELRITNATGGTQSPALTVPSATNAYMEIPAWAHSQDLWTGPVAFALQARRTGGAGNVSVFLTKFGLTFQP
jgi:hypothetical protein